MLTQKQILDKIETLFPAIEEHRKTGILNLTGQQSDDLREVITATANGYVQISMGCGSCVLHLLDICVSYYQREKPKYDAAQTEVNKIQDEDIINAMTQDKVKMTFPKHVPPVEPKVEEAKEKLSRQEILKRAREARKQNKKD